MEKKITELEMGLLHLQQNIDIPEITLTVHPTVAHIIKKASETSSKPQVADFGVMVEDSTFLNALQVQKIFSLYFTIYQVNYEFPSNSIALTYF